MSGSTLHQSGRKRVVGKGAPATGITAALRGLSSKMRILERFTMSGLKLESVHQDPLHTDNPTHGLNPIENL
ncbi:hypothetical protein ILYODFUR_003202 [Ilyodon furcidens]|uniref:Uncharacterized protein n=1 Tax=Ilyodon furcidens TaxID=33524 RepID=A0ABV0UQ40_9TELE